MEVAEDRRTRVRARYESGGSSTSHLDRLSALPDCLLHNIMSFMKARQVVQTCVLSKRWKHLWCSVPCLDVDYNEFKTKRVARASDDDNDPDSGSDDSSKTESADDSYSSGSESDDGYNPNKGWEDFEDFTVNLMLRCNIALLDSFRLHTARGRAPQFCSRLAGGWLRRAMKNRTPDHVSQSVGLSPGSWRLKTLDLYHVFLDNRFENHVSSVCHSLEELNLERCTFKFHSITSESLKSLVLKNCRWNKLSKIASPTLKTLVIDGGLNPFSCMLVILAPAVAYLRLDVNVDVFNGGISINEMPSLAEASIQLADHTRSRGIFNESKLRGDQSKLLRSVSNVTSLLLSDVGTMVLGKEPIFLEFKNLRNLLLRNCDLCDRTLGFFLHSSPNLERLTLQNCMMLVKDPTFHDFICLRDLLLGHCYLGERTFGLFPHISPNLEKVTFQHCNCKFLNCYKEKKGTPKLNESSSSECRCLDSHCEKLKLEIIYKERDTYLFVNRLNFSPNELYPFEPSSGRNRTIRPKPQSLQFKMHDYHQIRLPSTHHHLVASGRYTGALVETVSSAAAAPPFFPAAAPPPGRLRPRRSELRRAGHSMEVAEDRRTQVHARHDISGSSTSHLDRLSALPDCLLHSIMSFMKARQVVQTCVLSKRWEHLWRSVPCLDVDFSEFKTKRAAHTSDDDNNPDSETESEDEYDDNSDRNKDWEDFEDFTVNLMLRCNIALLDSFRLHTGRGSLPQFSNRLAAVCHSLEELNLERCTFKLHSITSGSLKSLVLKNCRWNKLSEIASPTLKTLVIDGGLNPLSCLLVILAPAVAYLRLDVNVGVFNGGISINEMPSLAEASIQLAGHRSIGTANESKLCGDQSELLRSVSNVTSLLLSYVGTKVLGKEPTFLEFKNLRNLLLRNCDLCDHTLGFFLHSSPNLERLTLQNCKVPRFQDSKNLRGLLLGHCYLGEHTFGLFLHISPNLEKVTLQHCKFLNGYREKKGTPKLNNSSSKCRCLESHCEKLKLEIIYKEGEAHQFVNRVLQLLGNLPKNHIKFTKNHQSSEIECQSLQCKYNARLSNSSVSPPHIITSWRHTGAPVETVS
ncbi:hypothetical protein U9M48_001876, partial [Paspalum notatum var. saurae]